MPLWTFHFRTLAYSIPFKTRSHLYRIQKPWTRPLPPGWSYSTASPANQLDDPTVLFPDNVQQLSVERTTKGRLRGSNEVSPITRSQRGNRKHLRSSKAALVTQRGRRTRRTKRSITLREPGVQKGVQRSVAVSDRRRRTTMRNGVSRSSLRVRKVRSDAQPLSRRKRSVHPSRGEAYLECVDWRTCRHDPLKIREAWLIERIRISYTSTHNPENTPAHKLRVPTLDVRTTEWVDEIIQKLKGDQETLDLYAFAEANGEIVQYVWPQVALWFMAHDHSYLLDFLRATHIPPSPHAWFVADCLRHLGASMLHSKATDKTAQLHRFIEVFCTVAQRENERKLRDLDKVLRRLLLVCSVQQASRLYQTIRQHRVRVRGWTYCHFVDFFAKHDRYHLALDALGPTSRRIGVNSWAFRTVCSTLLRRSISQPAGLRETLSIVSTIVDIGVRLDNPICDIIMLNAIEAGDLKTAFDVYHSLMKRGLKPTERTFTVLLKGCKINIDNAEVLNEVIRDAISNVNVRKSKLVADNILHCLALHHSKHHPKTALLTITNAFAQFYDLAPLKRLNLPMPALPTSRVGAETAMSASPHALGFMIGASINHALLHNPDPKHIFPLYLQWRSLVEAGDPALAQLATTDHIANIFLCAFTRRPSGLLHASRVIKDMQQPLLPAAGVTQAKPSVHSWNIFLHGFARHGMMKLAEQVRGYMRGKDMKEDTVTWNTLVYGYARIQDAEGGLETLRKGNESGAVWDRWSGWAVRKFNNREAKRRMAELTRERELDFTEDLKEGLEQRLGSKEPEVEQSVDSGHQLSSAEDGYGDSPAELAEQNREEYKPF